MQFLCETGNPHYNGCDGLAVGEFIPEFHPKVDGDIC
jgi:hypothetical protein